MALPNTKHYVDQMLRLGFRAEQTGDILCRATLVGDTSGHRRSWNARVVKRGANYDIQVQVTNTDFSNAARQLKLREDNGWQAFITKGGGAVVPPLVNYIKKWETAGKPATQWLSYSPAAGLLLLGDGKMPQRDSGLQVSGARCFEFEQAGLTYRPGNPDPTPPVALNEHTESAGSGHTDIVPSQSDTATNIPTQLNKSSHAGLLPSKGPAASYSIRSAFVAGLVPSGNPPRCLIFEGVPGTGKTFALKPLQVHAECERHGSVGDGDFAITLHPATAYEDFVEGLRPPSSARSDGNPLSSGDIRVGARGKTIAESPGEYVWHNAEGSKYFFQPQTTQGSGSGFSVVDGFFVRCCRAAVQKPEKWFIVLLDEINRCNIPKVFGDLLTTIEQSKRARWVTITEGGETKQGWDLSDAQTVTLPYSGRTFFVPDNIIVVGTMNTTDRSVAPMDAALRRRFAFMRVWPFGFRPGESKDLDAVLKQFKPSAKLAPWLRPSVELWLAINKRLHAFGDDALLGHSYLFGLLSELNDDADDPANEQAVLFHWNHYIFPQIIDIIQSNDLEGRVFKRTGTGEGELKDLSWTSVNEKEKEREKETTGLFEGPLPEGIAGKWTSRGEGMLRTLTLRLTAAGRVDKVATATQNEASKDESGTEQATEENSDSNAADPAQA